MYNKRKKHCAVIWLKGYYYSNDRNKSILSLAWCQWKGIITFSEENILVSKHKYSIYYILFHMCLQGNQKRNAISLWCWKKKSLVSFVQQKSLNQLYFHQIPLHIIAFYFAIHSVFLTHISTLSCYREWK